MKAPFLRLYLTLNIYIFSYCKEKQEPMESRVKETRGANL